LTALVTAGLTSAFWLIAFNRGPVADGGGAAAPVPPKREARAELELGPSGVAIPVLGVKPKDLIDTYKQARAGGARVHDAIDIMAPHGTPVVAAAPGRVEKLFFSKGGGGISAYVRSADNLYSFYYAHLEEYAPGLQEGQKIERGTRIGTVGSTGNASPEGRTFISLFIAWSPATTGTRAVPSIPIRSLPESSPPAKARAAILQTASIT
jgi:hypothetical protein